MTKIDGKIEKVELRCTIEQKKKIKELAKRKGMSVSKYILYRLGLEKKEEK